MSELERVLAELHDEGRLDSHGAFQLEWRRAFQKLTQFRLPEPGYVAVKLIQGLVGLGCTFIFVESDNDRLVVRGAHADPRQVSREKFQEAYQSERSERGEDGYRSFAVGVSTALSLELPLHLQVGAEVWLNGRFADGQLHQDVFSFHARSDSELTVALDAPWSSRVPVLVEGACHYCPVPIRLNGEMLHSRLRDAETPQEVYLGQLERRPPGWDRAAIR